MSVSTHSDMRIDISKKDLRRMELMFKLAPKTMRSEIKKELRKEAKKTTKDIRSRYLTGSGRHSLGRGPGIRTDKGAYGMKRQHTRMGMAHRVQFGRRGFGGYVRFGWGRRKPRSAGYIAKFQEWGTTNNPARGMMAEAAKEARPDMEKAINRGIDNAMEKM